MKREIFFIKKTIYLRPQILFMAVATLTTSKGFERVYFERAYRTTHIQRSFEGQRLLTQLRQKEDDKKKFKPRK